MFTNNTNLTWNQHKYIEFKNITFDGNADAATVDITVENQSFALISIINTQEVKIENCIFHNAYQNGISLSGVLNSIVINNEFYNCGIGALTTRILSRNAV